LVNMGGVDCNNLSTRVLKILSKSRLDMLEQITVVLGPHAPWHLCVSSVASDIPVKTVVLSGVDNMAELMTKCDLAIGAGGGTTWERCSLGVPTIQIELAENQKFINKEISKAGAAILCDVNNLEFELQEALKIVCTPNIMRRISFNASNITDGYGTQRMRKMLGNF